MNITHETNQLDELSGASKVKFVGYKTPEQYLEPINGTDMDCKSRKFYFSSDLNLFQRLWDWILHKLYDIYTFWR